MAKSEGELRRQRKQNKVRAARQKARKKQDIAARVTEPRNPTRMVIPPQILALQKELDQQREAS